jgi:hypothetical protein
MMFASLADWSHQELCRGNERSDQAFGGSNAKRLEAVAEQQVATNRMLEIDKEWRINGVSCCVRVLMNSDLITMSSSESKAWVAKDIWRGENG